MKKQYKLKSLYPGSPELGFITKQHTEGDDGSYYWLSNWFTPKDFPQFWEEVKEAEKLCVPIGTKFTHGNGETIFTISRVYGIEVDVTWNNGELPSFYNIKQVNSLFSNGTWKIYVEKPVLFVTEDGKEIREGDSYYYVYSDFMVDFSSSACKTSGTTGCKYFSTKELAQEYSDMNKPIYSKRQIIEALQRMDLVTRRVCNVPSFYEKFLV